MKVSVGPASVTVDATTSVDDDLGDVVVGDACGGGDIGERVVQGVVAGARHLDGAVVGVGLDDLVVDGGHDEGNRAAGRDEAGVGCPTVRLG